jgi:hypothetical protein
MCINLVSSFKIFLKKKNFLKEENEYFNNNIRLATTSILLNIINLLVQLPISVYLFLPDYTQINGYSFAYYLFYLSYSINFCIRFMFNSSFRKQFIYLREKNKCSKKLIK